MKRWRAGVTALLSGGILAGCATLAPPGAVGPLTASYATPLLNSPPASSAEKELKARIALALAYLELGRTDVAMQETQRAAAIAADHPLVHYAWGLTHLALNDLAVAEQSFSRALAMAPNDPDILHAAGSLACERQRWDTGKTWLQQAARNPYYPRRVRSLANLAWCQAQTGDRASADATMETALGLDPNDFLVRRRALELAARAQRWSEAQRHLQALLQLAGDEPQVWWLAANLAHVQGNLAERERWAQRLRSLAPASVEAQRLERGAWEAWQ